MLPSWLLLYNFYSENTKFVSTPATPSHFVIALTSDGGFSRSLRFLKGDGSKVVGYWRGVLGITKKDAVRVPALKRKTP